MLVLGSFPFAYLAFGRREIALKAGSGLYFNGIGRVGFSRGFTYDRHSQVHVGRTDYQVNGRNHYSVQLRESGQEASRMILAHGGVGVGDCLRTIASVRRDEKNHLVRRMKFHFLI